MFIAMMGAGSNSFGGACQGRAALVSYLRGTALLDALEYGSGGGVPRQHRKIWGGGGGGGHKKMTMTRLTATYSA